MKEENSKIRECGGERERRKAVQCHVLIRAEELLLLLSACRLPHAEIHQRDTHRHTHTHTHKNKPTNSRNELHQTDGS